MALPSSGALSFSAMYGELYGSHATSDACSLRTMSSAAGKSTPDSVSEFYSFSSLKLSTTSSSSSTEGQVLSNYITCSRPWTAVKTGDSYSLISSYTTSGSGSGSISATVTGYIFHAGTIVITYTVTGTSITATWTINIT